MKALLLKDFYVVTKQLRIFLFVIPFLAIFAEGMVSTFAIFLGAALPMTAIAYDEHSKWNEFATMMPYSKFEIIFSKYLLSYLSILGASIFVFIGRKIATLLNLGSSYIGIEVILFSIIGALVFTAINNPIYLKFGSEKGRFVFIGVMALIGASDSFFNNIDLSAFLQNRNAIYIILIIASIALNVASIYISIKISNVNK